MARTQTLRRVVRHWISKNPDLLARIERAHTTARTTEAIVYDVELRGWYVQSSGNSTADTWYRVDLLARTCTCPDSAEGKAPRGWCKHLIALALVAAAEAVEIRAEDDAAKAAAIAAGKRFRRRRLIDGGTTRAAYLWHQLLNQEAQADDPADVAVA